jgi:GNAT superfamily N-acetyltransferase
MAIRLANKGDLNQICNLLGELGGYDDTNTFMAHKLQSLIEHPDHYLFVDENNDVLDGLASVLIIPELGLNRNTALITYLVVSTSSRSKGIGKKLEQECYRLAKEKNCARIQLHCSATRIRAHKFYESLGYEESPKYFSKLIP